ncbi:MAG: ribosome small subunit-dependent GTPase [Pseudomonadota bacterium]|jgi:ribosome biogenesis GTPase
MSATLDNNNNADTGLVVQTQRRHFLVRMPSTEVLQCVAQGRDWQLACGDKVTVNVAQKAITALLPRTRLFYRADAFKQKLLAANVSQVVIVCAADPLPNVGLLNRSLVAAEATGVKVLLVANKADLPNQEPLHQALRPLNGLPYRLVSLSSLDERGVETQLKPLLMHEQSVFVGQSGVGKSSLLNTLLGEARQKVGELSMRSAHEGSGKHTTTFSQLFHLEAHNEHSWLVDSPGVQVFGLAHLNAAERLAAFPEFRALAGHCRFRDCGHSHEQSCALKTAVSKGVAHESRLQMLREFLHD